MKIWECRQNSEQWESLRRGIPTASEMHRIICPSEGTIYRCETCGLDHPRKRKKCSACVGPNVGELEAIAIVKRSGSADAYMYRLIAESMGATALDAPPNRWMQRGHDLEAAAVAKYEFLSSNDTQLVGFCTTDDGLIGASPDRLVGDDGLLEVKVPAPQTHIRHMFTGDLEDDHKVQVQSQLLVTGRQWVDVISYSEDFPAVIIHVTRNESFISGANEILVEFVTKLHQTRAELIERYGDFGRKIAEAAADPMGVSESDVDMLIAAGAIQPMGGFDPDEPF